MTKSGLFKNILHAGLLAGALDITAANLILAKGAVVGTLKFVASGNPPPLRESVGQILWLLNSLFYSIKIIKK